VKNGLYNVGACGTKNIMVMNFCEIGNPVHNFGKPFFRLLTILKMKKSRKERSFLSF
jgi:hypothetical protein